MMMSAAGMIHRRLLHTSRWPLFSLPTLAACRRSLSSLTRRQHIENIINIKTHQNHLPPWRGFSLNQKRVSFICLSSCSTPRLFCTSTKETTGADEDSSISSEDETIDNQDENCSSFSPPQYRVNEEELEADDWGWEEEEEQVDPKLCDGGDGGGVVFQGVPWGQRALSIAQEVLLKFGNDFKLFAFKTTPRGYIYVRLDKLSNEYGCPSMEELENYSQEYKKLLDEVGEQGEVPDNLGVEVSTPGAERIMKIPDDLYRFKDFPMRVSYLEDVESNRQEKNGVFNLESIETDSEHCVWKLADVKENRDPQSKGRPLSRKKRDWRLRLPFESHGRITMYVEF